MMTKHALDTSSTLLIARQPHLNEVVDDMTVEGIYRVSYIRTLGKGDWTADLIQLRDGKGSFKCLMVPSGGLGREDLQMRAVHVRFTTRKHQKYGLQGNIESLNVLNELPSDLVLDLLPCPKKRCLLAKRLRVFVGSLAPHLQDFILRVLREDVVTRALCVNPASRTFHHIEQGGLLRHCLETAERIGNYQDLCLEDRQIAQVAAFTHDIGKTLTLNWKGYKTDTGKLINHESLVLQVCAAALSGLEHTSRHLANLLRHIWTAAYRGQYGVRPQTELVRIVRSADRDSMVHDQWLLKLSGIHVPCAY